MLTGRTTPTTLVSGENDLSWDAGIYQQAALGDRVWHDRDGDGVQDAGEPGVPNVTVMLYENGTPIMTTTTDSTGFYGFNDLKPNTPYTVVFALPVGYGFTTPNAGGNDVADSDVNPLNGTTQVIILQPGEHNSTLDAGLWQRAGLGNYVWLDYNKDGQQQDKELGIAGVTVTLYMGGAPVVSTVTGNTGHYTFTNLMPGVAYTLHFSLPDGFVWTFPGTTQGSDFDSNVNANGATEPVMLQSGEFNQTIDAGVYSPMILDKRGFGDGVNGALGNDRLVTYTLQVINTSNRLVSNVVVSDPLPSNLQFVAGSATMAPDQINGQSLMWKISQIPAQGQVIINFTTRVLGDPDGDIENTAYVLRTHMIVAADVAEVPSKPTAVTLARFEVSKVSGVETSGVRVMWETSLEQDTFGFNVFRSSSKDRSVATQVTRQLIPATGRNGGASYEFIDTHAAVNQRYYYWLQETELSGGINEYGPVVYGDEAVAQASVVLKPAANVVSAGVGGGAPMVSGAMSPRDVDQVSAGAPIAPSTALAIAAIAVAPVQVAVVPARALPVIGQPQPTSAPFVVQAQVAAVNLPALQTPATPVARAHLAPVPQPTVAATAQTEVAGEQRSGVNAVLGARQASRINVLNETRPVVESVAKASVASSSSSTPMSSWVWLVSGVLMLVVAVGVVAMRRQRRK